MTTEKSNGINYSWSFSQSLNLGESPADKTQGLWAFDECTAFPLPNQRLLLKNKRTGNTVVVTQKVFQALQFCRQFKPLDEHVATIKKVDPALTERQSEVAQVFNSLIQQGFMASAKEFVLDIQSASPTLNQAPLFGILIRTCDRPKQLARLLKSFVENEARHRQCYQYVIMDDSKDPENRTENQNLADQFKKHNLDIYYYGWKEQQGLIVDLTSKFPEYKQLIEWLLGGERETSLFSGGRLWNHMLLLSAGKRFLTVDDDMVCQPHLSPHQCHEFEISARQREARFFLDREDLTAKTATSEIDPIKQHIDVLGGSLTQTIRHLSAVEFNEKALKYLSSDRISALHPSSPVLLTQSGIFGDPGTISTAWIYELEGEARAQLVENQDTYIRRRTSRHLWLGSSNFRFTPDTSLVSTLTGVDNQKVLPPSGPYFRNEDHLFGALVYFAFPDSLAFEFPWGLLHFPEPERSWNESVLDTPVSVGLLGFLADIANNSARHCYANKASDRMAFLAETYLALSSADSKVLGTGIEENLTHARVNKINSLHSRLKAYHNQPEYWAKDIERLLQANSQALMSKEQKLFPEDPAYQGQAQQVEMARTMLKQFGRSLQVWPLLWEYCKEKD